MVLVDKNRTFGPYCRWNYGWFWWEI